MQCGDRCGGGNLTDAKSSSSQQTTEPSMNRTMFYMLKSVLNKILSVQSFKDPLGV